MPKEPNKGCLRCRAEDMGACIGAKALNYHTCKEPNKQKGVVYCNTCIIGHPRNVICTCDCHYPDDKPLNTHA